MKIDFDEYLEEKFIEDEPQVLDDEMTDMFNDWLVELEQDGLIKYAQEYAEIVYEKAIKEAISKIGK